MKLLLTTIAAVLLVGCGASAPDISIHDAAERGNIEAVKQHLAAGTDVNAKDRSGFTPLHKVGRSKEVAELLIANGADLEAKTNQGLTPLCQGVLVGRSAIEVIELLIVKGADVNYVNPKDKYGRTQLDVAIGKNRNEIADLLRKHGGKHSTINTAAKAGDAEAVKEFLAAGADVNARGLGGLTPLDFAASKGDKETTDLLRKHGGKTYPELKAEGK